jgi:capsular exopolysaccharide synthesis family protein
MPPVEASIMTQPEVLAPVETLPPAQLNPSFLNDIRRRPWNPSYERLPALERGGVGVEQFRSLRSRIQEFRDLRNLKTLLVSSGLPQEGKSFIAVNLAINLARHKSSKVLLIDGDMRCSSLHHYLGSEFHPGLPDYLSGKATLQEVMQTAEEAKERDPAMTAVLNNITFIPGGDGGDLAADLSASKRFDDLLSTVAPYFDWIIVDSPPVLLVSDAVNLARACDAVLLVARSGVTTFPVAQRAQQELKASNILGFVLNAVEKPPMSGSYYYRYENKKD